MICIRCGRDSKYKERPGGICPGCNKRFAFEPKRGDPLTDAGFQKAIQRVSSDDTIRFTLDNLRYEVMRRLAPARKRLAAGLSVVSGMAVTAGVVTGVVPALTFLPGAVAAALIYRWIRGDRACLPPVKFDDLWQKWKQAHGAPARLIEPPRPRSFREPPDVRHYSFDRAVICDREATVDLLLANNFHFEHNCAVLAASGYPPAAFGLVMGMLKQNPKLEIFVLHDASLEGCTLAHRLATEPAWFPGFTIIDVGLRPQHAKPLRGHYLPAGGPVFRQPGVTSEEVEWLARYRLDLAVIRPEQILKRLFRAMNQRDARRAAGDSARAYGAGASGGSDGGSYDVDGESFSHDAGTSDGGADSFG